MIEQINEWGYALSQTLEGLGVGSPVAILVVFAAGVLTSLTPCVYPMIPVTVTYIGGAAEGNRRRAVNLSLIYVLGLSLVYASLGIAAGLLQKTFGRWTHSPWVYGTVALIILLFGLVMLDLVSMPTSAAFARLQSKGASTGGYFGALLMGIAAGFVAAPCTAPVLGTLLTLIAGGQNVLWGGLLMLVFSLGMGLLFIALGIFSGLLTTLPRSGVWMVWIKKIFGVGMLLLALGFAYKALMIGLGRG